VTQVSAGALASEPRLRLVHDQAAASELSLFQRGGERANFGSGRPLVVDLDGTLVRSDLLIETAFSELGRRPHAIVEMLGALLHGKAALKHRLAEPVEFDPAILPYDDHVLARIRDARSEGRPVYLASASNRRLVEAVARHLNVFAGWFASDETTNLAGAAKAERLVEEFGERGFDYIGNDAADLPVWQQASNCIAVRASNGVTRRLARINVEAEHLPHDRANLRTWAKLIRVHQWAKNALVLVPLLAAHVFDGGALLAAALAFVAFSLCASGVYVLNDLVDLKDNRLHHSKCNRPLARGAIPLHHGMLAVPLLFGAAFLVAAAVSWPFFGVLAAYFALTTAYSFYLKRKMLVDVITLATLYTVRVIGGAVAVQVAVSHWLLAFSMAFFVALALLKRFVELNARLDANMADAANRDYKTTDIPMVSALAAAAGFNAVTIFALYISSDTVMRSYETPQLLWLVCPMLLYWIGRALMLAQRRALPDDPVVFALKDKVSLVSIAMVGGLMVAAAV
jgi:4-hydroxybenzoate polyprenyltransferase/phosphoserine phosphatase